MVKAVFFSIIICVHLVPWCDFVLVLCLTPLIKVSGITIAIMINQLILTHFGIIASQDVSGFT